MTDIFTFWSDWQRAHVALEPDAEWLGSSGWTVPLWAHPDIVSRLRKAPGDLDTAFVRYYTARRCANLKALWDTLLASPGLRPWRRLLVEAIESYKDRRYAIVVPSLLVVLEGAVAAAAQDFKKRTTSPKLSATRKRGETYAGMRRLIWVSIEAFVKLVFGPAPFDATRPIMLNRHWILHGRDATTWGRRRECIRLFHALDTVAVTVDRKRRT